MTDNITDWSELREFKAVELAASFVLSWHVEGNALLLDLDLCLAPEHAFYETPRRARAQCIHPAVLEFPNCVLLVAGADRADEKAMAALASRIDGGRIRGMQRTGDGVYRLRGRFGDVTIHAERPILRLEHRPG